MNSSLIPPLSNKHFTAPSRLVSSPHFSQLIYDYQIFFGGFVLFFYAVAKEIRLQLNCWFSFSAYIKSLLCVCMWYTFIFLCRRVHGTGKDMIFKSFCVKATWELCHIWISFRFKSQLCMLLVHDYWYSKYWNTFFFYYLYKVHVFKL